MHGQLILRTVMPALSTLAGAAYGGLDPPKESSSGRR
jgi:hypothetical protein